MANETIEDIVRDVRHVSELHGMSYKDDKNWHLTMHNYTRILADRIESAHDALTAENAQAAYATRREIEDSIVDLVIAIIETRIQKEEKNGCEGK